MSFSATSAPLNWSAPAVSRVVIFTDVNVSPGSVSLKLKSLSPNVRVVSSVVVRVLLAGLFNASLNMAKICV